MGSAASASRRRKKSKVPPHDDAKSGAAENMQTRLLQATTAEGADGLGSLLRVHVVSGSWRDLGLLLPRRRVLKAVSGSFCSSITP